MPTCFPSMSMTRTSLSRICSLTCSSLMAMDKHLHHCLTVKNHKTRAAYTARVNTQLSLKGKGISLSERNPEARTGKRSALFYRVIITDCFWFVKHLLSGFFKIFFQTPSVAHNFLCNFLADVAIMPRFIDNTGHIFFAFGEPQNKTVFRTMFI